MSRLEVPLQHRTLRATGDTVLWADLVLSLKTNRGAWEELSFRVDSGTEMTTMPAFEAKTLDLPIPRQPVPGLILNGQEVRSGLLRRGLSVGPDRICLPLLLPRRPEPRSSHAAALSPGIDRRHQPDPPQLRRHDFRTRAGGAF